MDYVEWVERVLRGLTSAWIAADEYTRSTGVGLQRIADAVELGVETHSAEFERSKPSEALLSALRDLETVGWLETVSEAASLYRPTPEGRRADFDQLYSAVIERGEQLEPDHQVLLERLNERAEERLANCAITHNVSATEVFELIGWPWEITRAARLARELAAVGFVYKSGTLDTVVIAPTYDGLVVTTRQAETQWTTRLRELVAEGENSNVEFKRELQLGSDRQKAEFVKDAIALANSLTPGRRFIVVGFSDADLEFYESVDESLTQERFESILSVYVRTMPQIKYTRVRYGIGIAGVIEVMQKRQDLPYQVQKAIWKLEEGDIFVRHGTLSERPTPAELPLLKAAAERARMKEV